MKKYIYSTIYRGQQIEKIVCAKNLTEAAKKLEITIYTAKKYCLINDTDTPFDDIRGMFYSGMLWEKEKHLIRVEMPLEKLKVIVDTYKDKEYNTFK
jgi:hypothetical protein